ncbi:hypothetical protein ABEX53_31500 [Bacillus toyonensis]|uniref:hypothetical protein n=1 Tax=Bacillus toyonensis TaxID=155322 RepID=UPI0015E1690A|nr:hypothetical protein [Bacillus toyonensis]MED3540661.1 hypothetical protein [Bacillus toyonensis]
MFTTETFLVLCYKCKLTKVDLEDMTIGMCLDYIDEYLEMQKPPQEKTRKATQKDFNNF